MLDQMDRHGKSAEPEPDPDPVPDPKEKAESSGTERDSSQPWWLDKHPERWTRIPDGWDYNRREATRAMKDQVHYLGLKRNTQYMR